MNEQAYIYKTNGEIIPVLPQNNMFFEEEEMTKLVGMDHRKIELNDSRILIYSKYDKENKPYNHDATDLLRCHCIQLHQPIDIRGDVLVTPARFILFK